jgi:signal transduction histidine kinase
MFVFIIFGISYAILRQRYLWKLRKLAVDQHLVMERERISRELHDNIGTQLSYISNSIDWLVEALNIFRICQEAISNSVRHTRAERICLSIRSGKEVEFAFTIEDNGKGFVREPHYSGHYGLENMTYRAAESGATLSIESSPGRGTRVTVCK